MAACALVSNGAESSIWCGGAGAAGSGAEETETLGAGAVAAGTAEERVARRCGVWGIGPGKLEADVVPVAVGEAAGCALAFAFGLEDDIGAPAPSLPV